LGEVQRRYFDPVSSQAAYYGTVREGDETPIVTVRVRVESDQITEADDIGAKPAFVERLHRSSKFRKDFGSVYGTHEKLRRRVFNARRDDYVLHSYREVSHPSMQIVVAEPPKDLGDRMHYADVDIDLGNPFMDVKGFIIHVGELLDPDRTDHLKLRRDLARPPTGDHLHYEVRPA
jgi:hypothetical protein